MSSKKPKKNNNSDVNVNNFATFGRMEMVKSHFIPKFTDSKLSPQSQQPKPNHRQLLRPPPRKVQNFIKISSEKIHDVPANLPIDPKIKAILPHYKRFPTENGRPKLGWNKNDCYNFSDLRIDPKQQKKSLREKLLIVRSQSSQILKPSMREPFKKQICKPPLIRTNQKIKNNHTNAHNNITNIPPNRPGANHLNRIFKPNRLQNEHSLRAPFLESQTLQKPDPTQPKTKTNTKEMAPSEQREVDRSKRKKDLKKFLRIDIQSDRKRLSSQVKRKTLMEEYTERMKRGSSPSISLNTYYKLPKGSKLKKKKQRG